MRYLIWSVFSHRTLLWLPAQTGQGPEGILFKDDVGFLKATRALSSSAPRTDWPGGRMPRPQGPGHDEHTRAAQGREASAGSTGS